MEPPPILESNTLIYSHGVDSRALRWIHLLDPPGLWATASTVPDGGHSLMKHEHLRLHQDPAPGLLSCIPMLAGSSET